MTKSDQNNYTAEDQFLNDLKSILSNDTGERFISHLLKHFGLFKSSYSNDGHTEYNEGLRAAALYLSQQISFCAPQKLPTIIQHLSKQ